MMTRKRKPTTDAVEILHRRYFEGRPQSLAELEEARANLRHDLENIHPVAREGGHHAGGIGEAADDNHSRAAARSS